MDPIYSPLKLFFSDVLIKENLFSEGLDELVSEYMISASFYSFLREEWSVLSGPLQSWFRRRSSLSVHFVQLGYLAASVPILQFPTTKQEKH